MKKLILLTLLICSFTTSAAVDSDERCIREAENFGGQNLFSKTCENWMQKNAEIKKLFPTHELYAWKGVSILKSDKGLFIISGSNTLLYEIMDISVDLKSQKLAILNQTRFRRQILIFKAIANGDVAPQIVIEGPQVSQVQQVRLSEGANGLEIIGSVEANVWKWDLSKDSRVTGDVAPIKSASHTIIVD